MKVWDDATGVEVLSLKGHAAMVMAVAFSPDGTRIVSGSADRTAKIWDRRPVANAKSDRPEIDRGR